MGFSWVEHCYLKDIYIFFWPTWKLFWKVSRNISVVFRRKRKTFWRGFLWAYRCFFSTQIKYATGVSASLDGNGRSFRRFCVKKSNGFWQKLKILSRVSSRIFINDGEKIKRKDSFVGHFLLLARNSFAHNKIRIFDVTIVLLRWFLNAAVSRHLAGCRQFSFHKETLLSFCLNSNISSKSTEVRKIYCG